MELGLDGRRAIVTGASRGIGAAIASALAAEGVRVGLVARDEQRLIERASSIAAAGGPPAVVAAADLRTAEGVRAAMARCEEALGGVDILVNNAGASPFGTIEQLSEAQWQEAFDLKVMGYLRCMQHVLPGMRASRQGCVVNVGGVAGMLASPGYALGALNAAVIHLTRSTAELVAADQVRVLSVHPGPTLTDRIREVFAAGAARAGVDPLEYARQVGAAQVPMGRLGEVGDIAAVVVFLVSDQAGFTTGGGLNVDGGTARGLVGG